MLPSASPHLEHCCLKWFTLQALPKAEFMVKLMKLELQGLKGPKKKRGIKLKYINSTFHFDQVSLDSVGIWLRVSWLGKCCFGVSGIYLESHTHFLWRHVYANVLHYSQGYNSLINLLLWYHSVETEKSYILVLSRKTGNTECERYRTRS